MNCGFHFNSGEVQRGLSMLLQMEDDIPSEQEIDLLVSLKDQTAL